MKPAPPKSGSACKRKCCWSPFTCIKHGKCACHMSEELLERNAKPIALEQSRLREARIRSEADPVWTGLGIDPWKR